MTEKRRRYPGEQTCRCCGHRWMPRLYRMPRICPKCKSFDWRYGKLLTTIVVDSSD